MFVDGVIWSTLGNRCKDVGDGDRVEDLEKVASFPTDVEGSSPAVGSSIPSPIPSLFCSFEGAGAMGTKKLVPIAGFTDGEGGDWKELVSGLPLPSAAPLLNVSTYLKGKNRVTRLSSQAKDIYNHEI